MGINRQGTETLRGGKDLAGGNRLYRPDFAEREGSISSLAAGDGPSCLLGMGSAMGKGTGVLATAVERSADLETRPREGTLFGGGGANDGRRDRKSDREL